MPAIDGLSSGLDTTSIINQLMALERVPQQRLQTKQTAAESSITSLRTLNTKYLALLSAADKLGARLPGATVPTPPPPSEWLLTSASSSDSTRVAATATAGAPAGGLVFNVKQLATAGSALSGTLAGSGAVLAETGGVPVTTLTLQKGSDATKAVTISTAGGTLAETVAAINAAKAGVTASMVQKTPAVGATPAEYLLQLTSTTTGADSAVSLKAGTTELMTTTIVPARDAQIDIGGGTLVSRASNTMSDVLEGVTLTLSKADTPRVDGNGVPFTPPQYAEPPTTVTVKKDVDGIAARVQALVDAANAARTEAKSLTAMDPTTKAKGRLYGDSSVRSLVDQVSSAVSGGTSGPAVAGVTIARDGTISFDKAKFLTALAADPAKVEAALGKDGLAGRLHRLADSASRSESAVGGPGLITTAIKGRESQIETLKDGIQSWDARLAMKQKTLERQYTALETALSKAKSQGQWLAGQLANLPSGSA